MCVDGVDKKVSDCLFNYFQRDGPNDTYPNHDLITANAQLDLPMPDRLWQSIGMDFMGSLPNFRNNNYLLVIIDWLTSLYTYSVTIVTPCQCQVLEIELKGDKGDVKEGLVVDSNVFLRPWARGRRLWTWQSWSSGVGADRWTWL